MRVIINADDFGFDTPTVAATRTAILDGVITSATIMARMPGTDDALQFARSQPEGCFGAHLVFAAQTVEAPCAEPHAIASLLDERSGAFMSPGRVRVRALTGRISPGHIAAEARAQLAFLADHGLRLSHVDSHFHLHKFEVFRQAIATVLPTFGITRMRAAQNLRVGLRPWRPAWWSGRSDAARIRAHHPTTDWFVMQADGNPATWWPPHHALLTGPGNLEFGCHPGPAGSWRHVELESARHFARWCDEHGVTRIRWRDL